jgi:CubicO group peptidase (beta-lactamase class C family)
MQCRTFAAIVAGSLFLSIGAFSLPLTASEGPAWDALEARVDDDIEAVMQANNIPGMTVAVSKNGKLVLSKGYGYSMAEYKMVAMKHDMRTRIGSVSKVVVTGPAAFKLMKAKNIDRKTKKLYGAGGVFGNRYATDIKEGVDRFYPIVAMAISPKDRIYTWYANGKVSVGSSNDLDRYEEPRSFSLPPGKRITDIRDIGITKDSKVYVWYNDGSRSIGASRDLDMVQGIAVDKDGDVRTVKFPRGKSMLNVVGIAIAKSNNHVYVWYDDGTMSSGTSLDFTRYISPRPYSLSASRYGIRGMGIAANDHVYTWHKNGKAQSGTSQDLDRYIQPYDYSLPPLGRRGGPDDPMRWYSEITIQHLLNHRAGFQRSGDVEGAKTMFKVSDADLTYDQVHRHFLRTRPLRWKPGKAYAYSNHGFGIWTLIIEALSGKTYRRYAIDNYLKPLGLNGPVRPQTTNHDAQDAWAHELRDGKYFLLDFENSTLGLAAGGWTAAAQSLLKITDYLDDTYSTQELKDMGWAQETRGKLHHNGRLGGGTAYVVMFPAGYKSVSGRDLGDVHVAIAANIWTSTGALEDLASKIALEVPQANIAPWYDIWKGKPAN